MNSASRATTSPGASRASASERSAEVVSGGVADMCVRVQSAAIMHVHILGLCGTFMGGIAALARATGHRVTGSDQNVYPPMSDQLAALGIELIEGYDPQQLQLRPEVVVVGNVMSRGNALVEALLESGIPYTSRPESLARRAAAGRS